MMRVGLVRVLPTIFLTSGKWCHLVVGLLVLLLLCGCKTIRVTEQVPVVVEHTTTNNHTEWRTDTLYHKDSVYIYQQGDTLREYHERVIYKDKNVYVTDTVYESKPEPYEVVRKVAVDKPLTWWQRTRIHVGEVALLVLGAAAIYIIYRVTRG